MQQRARCPLCGSRRREAVYTQVPNLVKCSDCSLVYSVKLTDQTGNIYSKGYFVGGDESISGRDFFSDWATTYDRIRFSHGLRRLKNFVPRGARILDIGCATGNFLRLAQAYGYDCYGLDISEFAVQYVRDEIGVPCFLGEVASAGIPASYFDVVTMHHVLEHVDDPIEYLQSVKRVLRKGGTLVVEVPNFASYDSKLEGAQWVDLRPDQHFNQFEPRTLTACLKKSGFTPYMVTSYSPHHYYPLWSPWEFFRLLGMRDVRAVIRRALIRSKSRAAEESSVTHLSKLYDARGNAVRGVLKRVLRIATFIASRPIVAFLDRAARNKYLVVYSKFEP